MSITDRALKRWSDLGQSTAAFETTRPGKLLSQGLNLLLVGLVLILVRNVYHLALPKQPTPADPAPTFNPGTLTDPAKPSPQ